MPGIESRAPERTATSSGNFVASPNLTPMIFSILPMPAAICACSAAG